MGTATRIGIAVVRARDHVVVGLRGPSQTLSGFAEFPGGKCHPDESPEHCAVRECLEETGLTVTARRQVHVQNWSYDHGDVELHFWLCELDASDVQLPECTAPFRWVSLHDLPNLNFPPANAVCLVQLMND